MAMLYAATALILVVRVVEYVLGRDGYLLRNEWTLHAFDAVPMLAVTVLYGWFYPGELAAEKDEASSPSGGEEMGVADESGGGGLGK